MKAVMIWKENYLLIPIQAGEQVKKLEIFSNGEKKMEFRVPCGVIKDGSYKSDYYAQLPYKLLCQINDRFETETQLNLKTTLKQDNIEGTEITLMGDFPEEFFRAVKQSNQIEEMPQKRPFLHFTAGTGWINDPNGLVYKDGEYHLYFQYNPFNTEWENMSWGHAVSKNLLTWKQLDTVLIPDDFGTMFSGCAVQNKKELLGLDRDTILYFYTCAGSTNDWSDGKTFTQYLAYSRDNGRTLIKQKVPVIDTIKKENRDPKVFFDEKSQCYYMILWLEGNEFAILKSENLADFTITQTFAIPPCWECPDLFELQVKHSKEKKWVFWSADGYYVICDFEDGKITNFSERKEAYQSKLPYAAQTISGLEERVVTIPWLRAKFPSSLYTGAMGIPMELSLVKKEEEYILSQKPVKEYEEARHFIEKAELNDGNSEVFISPEWIEKATGKQGSTYEIELSLLKESTIELDFKTKKFVIENLCRELRILVDDVLIEVWSEDGTYYFVEELEENPNTIGIGINVDSGIKEIAIYQIQP